MKKQRAASSPGSPLPLPDNELLYVGIDVGKTKHSVSYLSRTLAPQHAIAPVREYPNSRAGFEALAADLRAYAPLEQSAILLEKTGHYHRPLVEFLFQLGLPIYVLQVLRRSTNVSKTDTLDARRMAVKLYNLLEVEMLSEEEYYRIYRLHPETETSALFQTLTRRYYESSQRRTALKNRLVAISDELFPERAQSRKKPSSVTSLALQAQFALPTTLVEADPAQRPPLVSAVRPRRLSAAAFAELQQLAATSIGTRNPGRQRGLLLEQEQLLAELHLVEMHQAAVRAQIEQEVSRSREGQILLSIPGIGPLLAGTILGAIGNIDNFSRVSQLKSFLGWGVQETQSGTSVAAVRRTPGGQRRTKQLFYLAVLSLLRMKNSAGYELYHRLLSQPTAAGAPRRPKAVIGRVAGQLIGVVFTLLKQDRARLAALPLGTSPPTPLVRPRSSPRPATRCPAATSCLLHPDRVIRANNPYMAADAPTPLRGKLTQFRSMLSARVSMAQIDTLEEITAGARMPYDEREPRCRNH